MVPKFSLSFFDCLSFYLARWHDYYEKVIKITENDSKCNV